MEGNQRHDFEVILLGDAGVGKTTLFIYLQTGKYVDDDARLTLGVDITYKSIKYEGKDIVVSPLYFIYTTSIFALLSSLSFLKCTFI